MDIINATNTIRFEAFQMISFVLTGSFFLWLTTSMIAWFINRVFDRPARR